MAYLILNILRKDSKQYTHDRYWTIVFKTRFFITFLQMPHIAVDALDQFKIDDTAFRKSYFFLNYLEYDPIKYG